MGSWHSMCCLPPPHHPQHSVAWGAAAMDEEAGDLPWGSAVSIPSIEQCSPLFACKHLCTAQLPLQSHPAVFARTEELPCVPPTVTTEPKLRARVTLICTQRLQNETEVSPPRICLAPAGST